MKTKFLLAFCLLPAACAKDGGGGDSGRPRVVERIPEPGALDVVLRDRFTAVFSEPIDGESLDETTVLLTGLAGAAVAVDWELSGDGKTLTVSVAESPALPATFTLALTDGIRDPAGNRLVEPETPWTFSALDWSSLGAPGSALGVAQYGASLALGSDGSPYVAVATSANSKSDVRVLHYVAGTWEPLGGVLDVDASEHAIYPSLAVAAADDAVVAFQETRTSRDEVFVRTWNGTSWNLLGAELNLDPTESARWPVVTYTGGTVTAAWIEAFQVKASKWNGTAWQALGSNAGAGNKVALADGPGGLFAATSDFSDVQVKTWNGTSWGAVGGILDVGSGNAHSPSMALTAAGDPVVAFVEPPALHAKQWNGTSWSALGGDVAGGAESVGSPTVTVDGAGRPIVAWEQFEATHFASQVRAFNGTSWSALGEAPGGATGQSSQVQAVAIDPDGGAVLLLIESCGLPTASYRVTRFNSPPP